jgi:hypothetical protein
MCMCAVCPYSRVRTHLVIRRLSLYLHLLPGPRRTSTKLPTSDDDSGGAYHPSYNEPELELFTASCCTVRDVNPSYPRDRRK